MNFKFNGYPRVFLHTGECFVGVKPTLVTVVLGSCVAVTMHCAKKRISTVCHAFLPDSSDIYGGVLESQPCRYVDTAVKIMLSSLKSRGADLDQLKVKIIGGGFGLNNALKGDNLFNVAASNVAMAQNILADLGLTVAATHVGGRLGRKMHLLTHTGEIWIKQVRDMDSVDVVLQGKVQLPSMYSGRGVK